VAGRSAFVVVDAIAGGPYGDDPSATSNTIQIDQAAAVPASATPTPSNTPTPSITPTPSSLAWSRSPSSLLFDEDVLDFQDVSVTTSNQNATWSASISGDSTGQLSITSGATGEGNGTIEIKHAGGSGIDPSVTLTITLTDAWTGVAPDLTVSIAVGV